MDGDGRRRDDGELRAGDLSPVVVSKLVVTGSILTAGLPEISTLGAIWPTLGSSKWTKIGRGAGGGVEMGVAGTFRVLAPVLEDAVISCEARSGQSFLVPHCTGRRRH